MLAMPRPRKPFTHREVTRHGKPVWYFRQGKGPRIRLPGAFGSREFNRAYQAALAGEPVERTRAHKVTFRWLVDEYYASGRYDKLRPNTQRNHRLMLEDICRTGAKRDYGLVDADDVRKGLVRREGKPRMAQTYLSVMRALFAFAKDSGLIKIDPTEGVKARQHETDGYHTWTLDEVALYQGRHPTGTQARLALDIMLYTGLRRSDAIRFGRQHIKNGAMNIRAGKNHAEITIPILPPLARSIEATDTGDMVFLKNARGEPWKNISFGYWFRKRCDEAGLTHCTAHGLRKAGATMAANNGASTFELTAMFGWSSVKMAEIYTRKADRVRLAERAANRLFPHHPERCGTDDAESLG